MRTARQLCRVREPAGLTSWLSAADARSLLEFVHRCVCCRRKGDFLALMPRLQSVVPFEHAYAISLRRDMKSGVIAPTDSTNVSFPEEVCRVYASRNYFQVDPIMWRSFTSHGVRHCSVEGMEIGRPREVEALCLDFGLRQGYVLGSGSKDDWSVFFFKGPSMKLDRQLAAVLEFAAPHLELAYSRAVQGDRAPANVVALSDREREILAWIQEGKSSWEMAVILGISERTANFHVANLTRKLGAVNRSQALAIAARLGLLRP
jgi:DNA-binding CsgD family transcriptional regulator